MPKYMDWTVKNPASCSLGITCVYCVMTKIRFFLYKTRNNFKLMNPNDVILYTAQESSYDISYGFILSFIHRNYNQQCNKTNRNMQNKYCSNYLRVSIIRINLYSPNLGLVHPVEPVFNENHKSIAFVRSLSCLYCTQYNATLHVSDIQPSSKNAKILKLNGSVNLVSKWTTIQVLYT
jgi:hypothetical protein